MDQSPISRIAVCLVNHLDILSNEQVHFKNFLQVYPIPGNLVTAQEVAEFIKTKVGVYELKEIVIASEYTEKWEAGHDFNVD